MTYLVDMDYRLRKKLKQLAESKHTGPAAIQFREDLLGLVDLLSDTPVESGEVSDDESQFGFVKYRVLHRYVCAHYLVHEERRFVLIKLLRFSKNHPYPQDFVDLLAPKRT